MKTKATKAKAKTKKTEIGTAPVVFSGNALYFTIAGGTFEEGDISGSFAPTVGGSAFVVYVYGKDGSRGSYECGVEGIIKAAIAHHRTRRGK